jgi:CheY-like chemotaxis protein/KaiC/GvpD/RAD55 family RecA-like ATPase
MKATGVEIVDRALGGVVPGLPLVVCGPPGSGRTVLALQLAHAALARGERAVFLTSEPPRLLISQAEGLGLPIETAVRDDRLVLLELDAHAAAQVRIHGPPALVEALRDAAGVPDLLVVEPVSALTEEILDESVLRGLLRELCELPASQGGYSFLSADASRLEEDANLSRSLADLAGTFVRLSRDPDGSRLLLVEKSRGETPLSGAVPIHIGSGGLALAGERRASDARPRTAAPPPEPEQEPETVPAARGRPQVLVVEDQAFDRERVADLLGRDFELSFAEDGFQAISSLMSARPDVILLDLTLPRVDGLEVLRSLHASGSTIPVLVTSGRLARATDRLRVLFLGAADVLAKPLHPVELRHKVETLLQLPRDTRMRFKVEDPGELLAVAGRRVLDREPFAERLERALKFGDRYGVDSAVLAVEAPTPEMMEAFVGVADETLRGDDTVGLIAPDRALVLLLLTPVELGEPAIVRLDAAMGRARAKRKGLRYALAPATAGHKPEDYFVDLRAWTPRRSG